MKHGPRTFRGNCLSLVAVVAVLTASPALPAWAIADAASLLRRADNAITRSSNEDVPLLAPKSFAAATEAYHTASTALKNKQDSQAIAAANRVLEILDKARSVAAENRKLLNDVVNLRTSILGLDASI